MTEQQIESLLRFLMRQASGGYYPTAFPMCDEIEGVDPVVAQRIYDRLIAELEAAGGPLPRWDSERNAPVPGTPEPR